MYNIWRTYEDIPQSVKEFMEEITNSKAFYFNDTYYCPICNKPLNNDRCENCKKEYKLIPKKILYEDYMVTNDFFVFDIVENDIYLYKIENYVEVINDNRDRKNIYDIIEIYQILSDRMLDLKHNDILYFKWIKDNIINESKLSIEEYANQLVPRYSGIITDTVWQYRYIYPYNLEDLKETGIYKDSNLWKLKEYLNTNDFDLMDITFFPICTTNFYDLMINKPPDEYIKNEDYQLKI